MNSSYLLYAFLVIMLVVGVIDWKKQKTPDDFYVAGRKMGVLRTSASLLATILGSSAILGSVNMAFYKGWAGAWLMLCAALGLLTLSLLVKNLEKFKGYHLPGLLEHFYGSQVKRGASAIIAFAWLGVVAAQFIGAAEITRSIIGISYPHALIIIGATVTLYTAHGGQHSIIRTDSYQAILILAGLVFIFLGLPARPTDASAPLPLFSTAFRPLDLLILLLTYASTYVAGPDIYSRLFCAKDINTARKSLLITAATLIPIAGILAYIGIFGAATVTPDSGSVLFSVVNHEFSSPVVYLFYFAMLAAIMSSADTTLFTAGELLTQSIRNNLDSTKAITVTRFAVVVLGAVAMAVALICPSILAVFLTALTLYSGAFVVPIIAGMAGLRTKASLVIIAMIAGGLLALVGKLYPQYGSYIIIAAFAINLLILISGARKRTEK